MKPFCLLVIEDDPIVISTLKMLLPSNWSCIGINSLSELNNKIVYHAAFVDIHLSNSRSKNEGVDVIRQLTTANSSIEAIAMSGDSDLTLMEACLQAGATRFISKPFTQEEIQTVLEKVEAHWFLRNVGGHQKTTWLGTSVKSNEVRKKIAELKSEMGPILLEGESGTGKEVLANLLHSQEKRGPLVSVNVAGIPENLFESELFGHIRGAFTGADQNKIGLAEAAHGGDLFLDEIEALPLHLQVKLLRFLETGEVKKVGAKDSSIISTRVIVATNQNLNQMVKAGQFREDLLWRISGKKIVIPPLRERKDDIAELAQYFLDQDKPKRNKNLHPQAIQALQNYAWPGNVRELKRVCEQLSLTSPLPTIRAEDVHHLLGSPTPGGVNIDYSVGLMNLVANYEKHILQSCLFESHGDLTIMADRLGISRSTAYKKIRDYNIEVKL